MIPFNEAFEMVMSTARGWGNETVLLENAVGRVLQQSLEADRDFPPFHRVTMDGIALRHADYEVGTRQFPIAGVATAGAPQLQLERPNHCLEVMTGAPLPSGTDTVIRYEDLSIENGVATVNLTLLQAGKNVHRQGSDLPKGTVIVKEGTVLSPAEIGVAATVGAAKLSVARLPKITLVATGNELVSVADTPLPHQIRTSNLPTLAAIFQPMGVPITTVTLSDDAQELEHGLQLVLNNSDVVILSGGVSMGKLDLVPETLQRLGVQQLFHKVKQRPGKPFWFGEKANGPVIFGLPGNPVSCVTGAYVYVLPWLHRSLGIPLPSPIHLELQEPLRFPPQLTRFLPVRLHPKSNGKLSAQPVPGNGSGDLASLVHADGLLILPPEPEEFPAGKAFPYLSIRTSSIVA